MAVAVVLLAVLSGTAGQASAGAGTTALVSESFTGSSTGPGWYLPAGSNGTCLTAATNTAQQPVPACSSSATDAVGSGALLLSQNVGNAVGTVYNTMSMPGSRGLDVTFNTYQWNALTNPGADGISFILAATDPTNPTPPAHPGPLGGSLGYSSTRSNSAAGVSYGYLGFGLDVYGNFEGSGFGGTDCPNSGRVQQSITVRGPGNDNLGYCKLASAAVVSPGHLDDRLGTTRPAPVPVEIAVNPGAATTTASGLDVAANSWLLQVTPLGGSPMQLTGSLPTGQRLTDLGFPPGYVDPATGLPYQLTFGWAASTGGNNEIHEINMLRSNTLNGKVPALTLTVSDNQDGHLVAGNHAVVTVAPGLVAGEGAEDQPVTVNTTFPPGLTPSLPTTPDYSCSVSGQLVTCRYSPSTAIPAGSSLPPLDIPVDVDPTATGAATITSKASSNDALPAATSHSVFVSSFAAHANPGSATYGSAVLLSTAGLPANATGDVTFSSGGTQLCAVTLPDTSCSAGAGLTVGAYPVTAVYSGDLSYLSQSTTTSFSVVPAATAVTAQVAATAVPYGVGDPLSAAGLPVGATGTVQFTSGGTLLCAVTLPATTCTPSGPLPVGSYLVTAAYSGDANHVASTGTTTFEVTTIDTALVAGVADLSIDYGSGQTLTWTGLDPTAGGTVTFESNGSPLCTATLPETSCTVPPGLAVGSYPVTATYSGDSTHAGSVDDTQFVVTKAPTDVVVQTSASVPYGTAQTLSVSGLPSDATGQVTLVSNGTPLCTITLPGTPSCSAPAGLDVATYPVTATYAGDDHYLGSSDSTTFDVDQLASPAFAAQANPASTTYGDPDTLSHSGLAAGATGTVTFSAGGQPLCAAVLPQTACQTADTLPVGVYQVVATYPGDDEHDAATATTSFEVTKAPVSLTASVTDPSLSFGTPQTLTAAGLPAGAQGTVTFTSGGVTLCTVTLPDTSCAAPAGVDVGQHPVQAVYSGDDNHQGASASTTFTVVPLASQVVANVASAKTPYRIADTLLHTGLPTDATGTVTFTANGRTLCVATLPAQSCVAPAGLEVGAHPVTATYSGDAHYDGSSDRTTFTVVPLPTSLTASASPAVAVDGTAVTLTAAGLPADATGTVRFSSNGRTLCVATLPTLSCASRTAVAAGTHAVRVSYSGDDHYLPSRARTTYRRTSVVVATQAASTRSGVSIAVPLPSGAGQVDVVVPPAHGSVVVQDGQLVYTPVPGFTGTDVVTVEITDPQGNVRRVDLSVEVLADPPSATTQLDRLPRTGGFAGGTLALAVGLLLLGAAAMTWGRRREV
ncbi:Ig-like domain repeat protein [Angustibacter sp. McL0619]|uniref:Ig-like domain repeat protein n=1 Tax=Angustibacter sp. McL0619 TaxID=3415676 RepID=UPI003CF11BCA